VVRSCRFSSLFHDRATEEVFAVTANIVIVRYPAGDNEFRTWPHADGPRVGDLIKAGNRTWIVQRIEGIVANVAEHHADAAAHQHLSR
jgi:hypothetical protein